MFSFNGAAVQHEKVGAADPKETVKLNVIWPQQR